MTLFIRLSIMCKLPDQNTSWKKNTRLADAILTALIDRLIWVISTVIVHITFPALRDAAAIPTLKLAGSAHSAGAVWGVLVWAVSTVVLPITLPCLWDTPLIAALPLVWLTLMCCWQRNKSTHCVTMCVFIEFISSTFKAIGKSV